MSSSWGAALAGLSAAGVLAGAADPAAAQFDPRAERGAAAGGAPLVAGPPPGPAWRLRRSYGMQLPLAVDGRLLAAGLGPSFALVLPLPGGPRDDLLVVVDEVRADGAGSLPPVPGLPRTGLSVVYTGLVRGERTSVAVLSVVRGVLYSRVVVGETAWVLYSDPLGGAFVRITRRGDPPAVR